MLGLYRLDGHVPVPCSVEEHIAEWRRRREGQRAGRDPWRVDETHVGSLRVSTVFLGIDHRYLLDSPPQLFETMIFGPGCAPQDDLLWRCATWDEAVAQHADGVRLAEVLGPRRN